MGAKGPKEDITGLVVKNWIVREYTKGGHWLCECKECGMKKEFIAYHLKDNRVKECLHSDNEKAHSFKIDLSGKQFGELKVKGFNSDTGKWICECSCGNIVEHTTYELNSRGIKSCGHSTNKLVDISGKKFGELTAIKYMPSGKWLCQCSCNKEIEVNSYDLRSGNTKSCGHAVKMKKVIDIKGNQFGELIAKEYLGNSLWKCQCSCGKYSIVHSYALRTGKVTSCGDPIHKVKDLSNKKFGELTAIRYIGNAYWECKCSCGNTKNILGTNLRNESTKSCGCITDKLMRQTLMNKYGDTCPSKASNPRTAEQLEILSNKEMFAYFIIKYASMCGKPNSYELAKIFSVDRATILNKVRQYNIENMIVIKSNISNEEKQLQEYIKSITTCNVITNSKKIVDNYELDIYIPEKKIAIEFNGTYWHSTLQKDKKYHQNKTLACAKQGIRLIHIFEYEWKDEVTQTKIKEYLSSLLNDNRNVIYARKTEIKEITSETAKQFLEQYHLQGYIASKINIGCFYENNLIGVLTFGFPRFNHSCQYELHRLCWKSNVAVIGGLEKMFSYFKKTYNPTSIITYSDITKFTGNCYLKLGFKVESITEPNYVWVEDSTNKVLPRYQTQKHKLIKAGLGEETQTEDEIMNSLGYLKVYNSGNIKLYWE